MALRQQEKSRCVRASGFGPDRGRAACLAITLLVAGCATPGDDLERGYAWYYRTSLGIGDPERPIGLYGLADTSADYVLECAPAERRVQLVSVDVEPFAGMRPIVISAGGTDWRSSETLDPANGQAMSRASIPIDHPVLDAIAGGSRIGIRSAAANSSIMGGPIPARVVRECRARASRTRT